VYYYYYYYYYYYSKEYSVNSFRVDTDFIIVLSFYCLSYKVLVEKLGGKTEHPLKLRDVDGKEILKWD
jgi:hypothetical protein